MCDKPTIDLFDAEDLEKVFGRYQILSNLVANFGAYYRMSELKQMRGIISDMRDALAELDSSLYPIGD